MFIVKIFVLVLVKAITRNLANTQAPIVESVRGNRAAIGFGGGNASDRRRWARRHLTAKAVVTHKKARANSWVTKSAKKAARDQRSLEIMIAGRGQRTVARKARVARRAAVRQAYLSSFDTTAGRPAVSTPVTSQERTEARVASMWALHQNTMRRRRALAEREAKRAYARRVSARLASMAKGQGFSQASIEAYALHGHRGLAELNGVAA